MKKKVLTGLLAGVLAVQLTACGTASGSGQTANEPAAKEADAGAEKGENTTQMANPWREITAEEAGGMVPNLFSAPEGAVNERWSAMGEYDPANPVVPGPMIQLDFDLDGMHFTERAQVTGDNNEDISGMYYDWTVSDEDITLANWGGGNMKGKTFRHLGESETADLITWYDVEIGISYSLSVVAPDLDGFDIQAVAEASYDAAKQEGASIP